MLNLALPEECWDSGCLVTREIRCDLWLRASPGTADRWFERHTHSVMARIDERSVVEEMKRKCGEEIHITRSTERTALLECVIEGKLKEAVGKITHIYNDTFAEASKRTKGDAFGRFKFDFFFGLHQHSSRLHQRGWHSPR